MLTTLGPHKLCCKLLLLYPAAHNMTEEVQYLQLVAENKIPFCRNSIEVLNGDMNKLDSQIKKISKQMEAPNTEKDVAAQMEEFLPVEMKSYLLKF